MKLLLYCTKAKPDLVDDNEEYKLGTSKNPFNTYNTNERGSCGYTLNGKIVAECDFEVEDLRIIDDDPLGAYWYETKTLSENEVLEKSCLTGDELFDYLGEDNEGYAIHIKNLHIFGKPRELSDYLNNKYWNSHFGNDRVSKAPQNMIRVYKLKDIEWEEYILISIQPQWLCKILNGEKTIEVRKKVLKEMLE